MPSHSIMPSPIASRKLPLGRSVPRSAGRNIQQRLGEKFRDNDVVRRSIGDEFNEWNDRRGWNDNSGGPGLMAELHAPPPPENLDWNTPYRRHEVSPNTEAFMDFNDQPPDYNNDVYVGSERFAPNDFHRGMEQPVIIRNFQDVSNSNLQDSYSSGGYHSFEARRGDSSFMESSPSLNYLSQEISSREYSGSRGQRNDQWRPYDPPEEMAKKRRREPSPRASGAPRAAPEMLDRVFHIGGYKLPYISHGQTPLPQPESKSYLTRFFKRTPAYRISSKKGKERSPVDHVYVESVEVNEFEVDNGGKRFSLFRFRDDITKELTKVYRARFYRNWDGWWKDFHSINIDIDEQLAKFEDFNVKYNFMPQGGTFDFVELNNRAKIALTKNRNNYLGNMRVIYSLMNHTVLANMPMEVVAELQDTIRSVPNHLWIYKLRCMVYLWYNYKQVMSQKDTHDKKYQYVLKEWNSPVIHWVTKQAFFELRNISQVEFPEYLKLYGKNNAKDAKA
ncbi:hypothetical protein KR054_000274 [Drosophila jambulina]|nr:hypothetical protein KR054_000274 [Drosophila jambulina]